MIKPNILMAVLIALATSNADAACSLKSAEDKMIMVTIMAQVYAKESFDYMGKGENTPVALKDKQAAISAETNVYYDKLAKVFEANPEASFDDEVDTAICHGLDAALAKHQPIGYQAAPILRETTTDDPSCTSDSLWKRFSVSLDRHSDWVNWDKLDLKVHAQYLRITTDIVTLSAIDLKEACAAQENFETMLASL